ncbi:MAG: dihydrodipicolinate reductase, partial [Gemmatimonadota bacterium]
MPAPASPVRVIQMGLGPIGQRVVQYLVERRAVQLAAAIDIDPAKVGRDAGELCGVKPLGVAVTDQVAAALATPAEVVLLTTGSTFAKVVPQIEQCLRAGKSVVSTCEELAFPWDRDPALARRVDQLARERGAVVLGTGVNPGFLMDALPIFLTSVCRRVDRVRVERHQDAAQRRLPFQQKIGAGLTPAEFEQKRAAGVIRHVGFEESIRMVARALGWTLERVEEIV